MKKLGAYVLFLLASTDVTAWAQSIQVDDLGGAAPFQPGVLESGQGGLDAGLWTGTSAELASYLIEKAPIESPSIVAQDLIRAALLSSGVPPKGETQEAETTYSKTRLAAMMKLGEMQSVQTLANTGQSFARDPSLMADIHLIAGDFDQACQISDNVTEGRGQADRVALRGLCHVVREEIPAAELVVDLLKSREDFEDPSYFNLIRYISGSPGAPNLKDITNSPRHIALMNIAGLDWPSKSSRPAVAAARKALDPIADPAERLSALWAAGPALSDAQIRSVIDAFKPVNEETDLAGDTPFADPGIFEPVTLEDALALDPPQALEGLYAVLKNGAASERPLALYEILSRADKNGAFKQFSDFLEFELVSISADQRLALDLPLFTRLAVMNRDIGFLQQAFLALEGQNAPQQARIALAADALGNGFYAGTVGTDIETRLASDGARQKRARRDALIAHAMGASLSDDALKTFDGIVAQRPKVGGEMVGLLSAAKKQSRAETALWAARILDKGSKSLDDMTLHSVISALNAAGLTEFAGRIAAEEFLTGLKKLPVDTPDEAE